jgi:hypothetical protein
MNLVKRQLHYKSCAQKVQMTTQDWNDYERIQQETVDSNYE